MTSDVDTMNQMIWNALAFQLDMNGGGNELKDTTSNMRGILARRLATRPFFYKICTAEELDALLKNPTEAINSQPHLQDVVSELLGKSRKRFDPQIAKLITKPHKKKKDKTKKKKDKNKDKDKNKNKGKDKGYPSTKERLLEQQASESDQRKVVSLAREEIARPKIKRNKEKSQDDVARAKGKVKRSLQAWGQAFATHRPELWSALHDVYCDTMQKPPASEEALLIWVADQIAEMKSISIHSPLEMLKKFIIGDETIHYKAELYAVADLPVPTDLNQKRPVKAIKIANHG